MRHIKFNESSVLNEFARIASEKGLVKVAQDVPEPRGEVTPAPEQKPTRGPGDIQTGGPTAFDEQLREYPTVSQVSSTGTTQNGTALLKELSSPGFKRFFAGWSKSPDQESRAKLQQLANQNLEVLRQLQAQVKRMPGNYQEAYLPSINQALKMLLSASGKQGSVKEAEDMLAPQSKNWPARIADALQKAAPSGGTALVPFNMVIKDLENFSPETPPEVLKEYLKKWFKTPGVGSVLMQQLGPLDKKSNAKLDGVKMAEEKLYDVSGETGEQLVEKAHPGGGTKTELTHSKTDENLVETIVEQQEKDVEVAKSVPKGTYAALVNLADRLDKMGYYKAANKVDSILKKKL